MEPQTASTRCPSCKGKPPYHHKNCALAPEKPVIEAMRSQVNHQEEETKQMVGKIGELQEHIGKLKGLLHLSHAFMRRCYPRLSEGEMPRNLMKAIADEVWGEK